MGFFLQAKVSVLGTKLAAPASLCAASTLLGQVTRQFPEAVALTTFFAVFGVVIALMKDVPDVRGDVEYKIPSFSVKLGAAKMFRLVFRCVYFCSVYVYPPFERENCSRLLSVWIGQVRLIYDGFQVHHVRRTHFLFLFLLLIVFYCALLQSGLGPIAQPATHSCRLRSPVFPGPDSSLRDTLLRLK